MLILTIILVYLCFIELILLKFIKKHGKIISTALVITALCTVVSLLAWGLLRNF